MRLPEETLIVQTFTTKDTDSATVQRAWRLAHGSVARLVDILAKKDTAETAVQLAKRLLAAEPFERLSLIDTELKDKQRAREAVDALVMIASASLAPNERLARWQRVLTAGVTAQQALAQNANQKLALTELMLAL